MLLTRPATVSVYDFRRPNKLSREHVRALQIVFETFSRQLATVLSTSLRAGVHASFDEVTQVTYDEFVSDLPNPTMLAAFELQPLKGNAMLHLPPALTIGLIERLLGGSRAPQRSTVHRAPTEIEVRLVKSLLDRVFRELAYAFESLVDVTPAYSRMETNPQFAQLASATDMIISITMTVRLDGEPSQIAIGLPFSTLQPVLDEVAERSQLARDGFGDELAGALSDSVQAASMEVRVRFAELAVPSRRLSELRPGDVLSLEHPVDQPLTVEVAGVPRFLATAGTRGKRVACLLTDSTGEVTPS